MENYLNPEEVMSAKRFELAKDDVARSRLDKFRDTLKMFQDKHPEVLGATVYGSMIKGEAARAQSDVDAFLYIDADTLPEANRPTEQGDIQSKYRSDFLNELGIPEEEAERLYGDLIPKLLSSEILSANIKANVEYESAQEAQKRLIDAAYDSGASDEEKQRLFAQEIRSSATDNFEIAGMFHARVGSGIEKYRRLFLEKLAELPNQEIAKSIWSNVYAQIETMEAGNKSRRVPRTLDDALMIYHPDLYKKINKDEDTQKIKELGDKIRQSFS
jgi:predicted nucleotidyltransferase